jgi:multidrug efflux pump
VISRFFIDRPIFASVLSIVITLAGGLSLVALPVAMYPPVSPPTVEVSCSYPGASAKDVAEAVAAPIEQQVNGVENMMYMSSQCANDGSYSLTITFKHGVDLNLCQVLVQNRVSLATPLLPEVIRQTGVTTRKRSPDVLLAIAVNSPNGRYDQVYLSNFTATHLKEEIARLPGVSEVFVPGQRDYSMRIWVDPDQMASRDLTAGDVVRAIREQNMALATGQIGQEPAPAGQQVQIPLSTLGRLTEPEQFGNIVLKATADGKLVRIRDVARVELDAKNQDITSQVNGKPSVSLVIFQLPDANALDVADTVRQKMAELKDEFPEGIEYEIRYDTTPFIRESIHEVFKTLREAVALVALVVLLFLQNWRSAIIPLIAVPVGIVGTFAVMLGMGFSLNNLTLFGLVLAIGIVVDDAIVVVESVEHHIEQGMGVRPATIRAMEEVSGPIIAIGLVLTAVFVPCAFISGITGQFYRQFALTIAASTLISTVNSLTLSPALAAVLLKPKGQEDSSVLPRFVIAGIAGWFGYQLLGARLEPYVLPLAVRSASLMGPSWKAAPWGPAAVGAVAAATVAWVLAGPLNWLLYHLFRAFNFAFRMSTRLYTKAVGVSLRLAFVGLAVYGGLLYVTYRGFNDTPKGFIPSQDMGYLLCNVQLPDATSAERTVRFMRNMEKVAKTADGVKHTFFTAGTSMVLNAAGSNFASMFIILDDFANRRKPELHGEQIANVLRKKFAALTDGQVTIFPPPPVRGVGRAGGYRLMVEDRGDNGAEMLQGQTENVVEAANAVTRPNGQPALLGNSSVFRANVPQLFVDVNRKECLAKEVPLTDVFDTLQVYLGSRYVNDFNLFGRTWQVIVQADARFRNNVEDVRRLKVRNVNGGIVPLGTLATVKEINGPLVLTRYNMYPAAPVQGNAGKGVSSGDAINIMQRVADRELLHSMSYEWTELAYLELEAGDTAMVIFGFSVVAVFLVLAALYESWSLPLAIILVVPICLLSGIAGVRYKGEDINIFTQIGFVVLVGLASKNAILIVEYAKMRRGEGASRREATLDACRLRLRPIIMTSAAFVLGVVPLVLSVGAGAEMRRTLGTTVFSGMLGVTFFGIVLTPIFFFVIDWLGDTPLFRSRFMRRLNALSLVVLTAGPVRTLGRRLRRRFAPKPRPIEELDELPARHFEDYETWVHPRLPRDGEPVDESTEPTKVP